MNDSLRQYNCARCGKSREICGWCDRGNIYCGIICSTLSRLASLKAAAERYRASFKGRFNHAERQKNYRARERVKKDPILKIVTHQGSPPLRECDVVLAPVNNAFETIHGHCDFCGRFVGEWLRRSFYKRRSGGVRFFMNAEPQGS